MKAKIFGIGIAGAFILASFWGLAQAEYDQKNRSYSSDSSFDDAVNLQRFRKGNPDWDTQELVASGLTALHREHVEILRELADLKEKIKRLEAKQ